MIAERLRATVGVWLPVAVLMLILLATESFGDAGRALLQYDREAIASGQWWRLLTGNFVHLGWYHWFLNEVGLLVLLLLCPERLSPWVWLRRLLLIGCFMTGALLLWVPEMGTYVGLSGVQHGLFLLGLGRQVVARRDPIAVGCLLFLFGKLAWELVFGVAVSDEAAIGGRVALESHLYGAIGALVYGLVFRSFIEDEKTIPNWRRA